MIKNHRISVPSFFLVLGTTFGMWVGHQHAQSINASITAKTPSGINLEAHQVQVCFTPGNSCLAVVEKAIHQAKRQILVQAYSFTSPTIVDALIAAHKRGVTVRILADRSQIKGRGSKLTKAQQYGLSVAIEQVPGIAHNKVILIDDSDVITGSFNWSNAAEYRNSENLLLIHNRELHTLDYLHNLFYSKLVGKR